METETIAQAALAMVTLPDDVNFLEAIVLPRGPARTSAADEPVRDEARRIRGDRDVVGLARNHLPLVDERGRIFAGDEAGGCSPAASAVWRSAMCVEAAAMCGVMITLGIDHRGDRPGNGSISNTSRAAPAIVPGLQRRHQVGQIDDRPAADVDEIAVGFICRNLSPAEELVSLRRVRGGDHHEIALPAANRAAARSARLRRRRRALRRAPGSTPGSHAEAPAPAGRSPRRCSRRRPRRACSRRGADAARSISLTKAGPAAKSDAPASPPTGSQCGRAAGRGTGAGCGRNRGRNPSRGRRSRPKTGRACCSAAGMLDQRVEHVMLEAGGRRLHPAQLFAPREQRRRDLAEKCVGLDDFVRAPASSSRALTTVMAPAASQICESLRSRLGERARASWRSPDRLDVLSSGSVALSMKKNLRTVLALGKRAAKWPPSRRAASFYSRVRE